MSEINVSELGRMTDQAIECGRLELEQQVLAEQAETERKRIEDEMFVKMVIAQIPEKARIEAITGRRHAIVTDIGYIGYDRPRDFKGGFNICKPEWLKGTARIIYEYCQQEKLKPTLEHWHDGVGIKEGFNIVIHW